MLFSLMSIAQAGLFQATLASGTPEFSNCLEGSNCQQNFYQFLTHSMMEQGLSMQSYTVASTPLLNSEEGWGVGAGVNSFPFSPPQANLSGKEENTSFSPVFPSLTVGYRQQEKSYTLKFLPPVPVQGAAAFLLSGNISRLLQEERNWRRTLDTELGMVRAKAPITASEEQIENRDSLQNPDNLRLDTIATNCPDGCIDTYYHVSLAFRIGQSWQVHSNIAPYVQLELNNIYEHLAVQYDQTGWQLFSMQPMIRSGVGFQFLDDRLVTVLGGMVAPKYPTQDRDGNLGVFYTTTAQFVYSF